MAEDRHDWEADPRPFGACLKDWQRRRGMTRERAADEIRTPLATYHGWCAGRPAPAEGMARRLMTALDTGPAHLRADSDAQ